MCLELQAAGLYDTDTGTWLDVLSLAGLDGPDAETAARVDRWLTGHPDPALDRLDLTEHVDRPGDLDWALHAAIDELPAMRVISWVLTAQDLLEACETLTERRGDDLDRVGRSASMIARLAEANLATVPGEPRVASRSGSHSSGCHIIDARTRGHRRSPGGHTFG